jgi:hypothetical protein
MIIHSIPLNIDGKLYKLRLTMAKAMQFENITGVMLSETFDHGDDIIFILFWIMCEPAINFEESKRILTGQDMETACKKLFEAVNAAFYTGNAKKSTEKPDFLNFDKELKLAMEAGRTAAEFWDMTYAEYYAEINVYIKSVRDEKNKNIVNAYNTACLIRAQEMPSLESLLIPDEPKTSKPQTPEQMIAMAEMFTLAFGGTIIKDDQVVS